MKTTIKIIAALLGILLAAAIIGGLFIWSTLPKLSQERLELPHNVVSINTGFAYAWLIPTEHGVLLIDAGHDKKGTALKTELSRQGLSVSDVHTIILTHGHTDHWGGTAVFPNATVYIHEADVPLLSGDEAEANNPLIAFFQQQMTKGLTPPANIETLSSEQTLDIDGEQVTILPTSGHTPGSIAILWQDILFLGDSVQKGEDGLKLPPQMFGGDPAQIKASLTPLLEQNFAIIAVAHSDYVENGRVQLQQFINQK